MDSFSHFRVLLDQPITSVSPITRLWAPSWHLCNELWIFCSATKQSTFDRSRWSTSSTRVTWLAPWTQWPIFKKCATLLSSEWDKFSCRIEDTPIRVLHIKVPVNPLSATAQLHRWSTSPLLLARTKDPLDGPLRWGGGGYSLHYLPDYCMSQQLAFQPYSVLYHITFRYNKFLWFSIDFLRTWETRMWKKWRWNWQRSAGSFKY